jgi:hypothetical protein
VTFYNVISGILFMGACQALVHALGQSTWGYAATLVVIMANEAVLTSELIEGASVAYTLGMKFLDLSTFVILSYALLVVSPDGNAFSSGSVHDVPGLNQPFVFFMLLTIYAGVMRWWNTLAGKNDEKTWRFPIYLKFSRYLFVPLLVLAAVSWALFPSFEDAESLGVISFLLSLVYFLLKLIASKPAETPTPVCKFSINAIRDAMKPVP